MHSGRSCIPDDYLEWGPSLEDTSLLAGQRPLFRSIGPTSSDIQLTVTVSGSLTGTPDGGSVSRPWTPRIGSDMTASQSPTTTEVRFVVRDDHRKFDTALCEAFLAEGNASFANEYSTRPSDQRLGLFLVLSTERTGWSGHEPSLAHCSGKASCFGMAFGQALVTMASTPIPWTVLPRQSRTAAPRRRGIVNCDTLRAVDDLYLHKVKLGQTARVQQVPRGRSTRHIGDGHAVRHAPAIQRLRAWSGYDWTGGSTASLPGRNANSTEFGERYETWTTWSGETSTAIEAFPARDRLRYGYDTFSW